MYVGVDVFGRGCYGGGGFACDQALAEIVSERKGGQLSIAIFAPGWTHETRPKNSDILEIDDQFADDSFFEREHRFWAHLEDFLNFRSLACIGKNCTNNLIFSTTFNSGSGIMKDIKPRNVNDARNSQCPAWFLNLDAQDVLPVFLSHSSKTSSSQTHKHLSSRPFNIYLSNDAIETRRFQGNNPIDPINASNIGTEPTHLLMLDGLCEKGRNWLFCNRISSIPLFLNKIATEKKNLLFVLDFVTSFRYKEERNVDREASFFSPKPHLIIRFEHKRKNKYLTSTLKLCPYSSHERSCLHSSDNEMEKLNIHNVIKSLENDGTLQTNSEHNRTLYYLCGESLKSKFEMRVGIISAVLIEAPLGRQSIGLSKFEIYEA